MDLPFNLNIFSDRKFPISKASMTCFQIVLMSEVLSCIA